MARSFPVQVEPDCVIVPVVTTEFTCHGEFYKRRAKNAANSASASSPIVNPGRRGVGKAPKCNKWEEDCHVDELNKRKKSVRAHKLPRAFVRWPLGPRTEGR